MSPLDDDARAQRREAERRSRRAAAARRRLVALAVLAASAAVVGAIVGAPGDDRGDTGEPSLAAPSAPACPPEIAADPRRLAGQMVVVRMEDVATGALRRLARRGELGGVVLFPSQGTSPPALGRQVEALRAAAAKAGAEPPLVMIDQEGGEVKRLADLPPDRAPGAIGAAGSSAASAQGRATGKGLAGLGIDVDLAPVLDVPGSAEAFIASRALGSEPAVVTDAGIAFGEGLQAAGVAATAKHFPGLGLATVNTDLAPTSIDATRAELEPGLEPFRAAIGAGFGLVMVSNATYPAYDAEHPASQSPRVIDRLLRRRLGFEGAVVTDDLGAQALVGAGIDEAEAALTAARAGADLLLFALSDGEPARDALAAALRRGELDRKLLIASCARSTALRERLAGSAISQ